MKRAANLQRNVPPDYWSKLADKYNVPPVLGKSPADEGRELARHLEVATGPKLRVAGKLGGERPPPFERLPPDPTHFPRKWAATDGHPAGSPVLKRGTIVFYHGLRYWVERVPASWKDDTAVWISDDKIHPDATRLTHDKRESFCVHADLLTEAPQPTRLTSALPTVASAARKERADKGIRDVDDEVAQLLRACADLEAVYKAAAKYLGTTVKDLKAKYGHLNPGQQRMNCGNKMRFKWKQDNGLAGRKGR